MFTDFCPKYSEIFIIDHFIFYLEKCLHIYNIMNIFS